MLSPDAGRGAPSAPRARSELGLRVLSGIVMVAVALIAAWAGGLVFSVLWLAAAIAVAFEWTTVTGLQPRSVLLSLSAAGLCAVAAAHAFGTPPAAYLALACLVAAGLAFVGSGRARAWAPLGFAYAAVLALAPPVIRDDPALGLVAILWMFAVVWGSDIGGYFAGRKFGGPKLWPSVSPKKTWSGFAGGLLAAIAAGLLVTSLAPRFGAHVPVGWLAVAIASAIASVASQLGDLGESALKRRFGAKDSGRLIPGHGGVMDRLDGFVAVAFLFGLALAGSRLAR